MAASRTLKMMVKELHRAGIEVRHPLLLPRLRRTNGLIAQKFLRVSVQGEHSALSLNVTLFCPSATFSVQVGLVLLDFMKPDQGSQLLSEANR